MVAGWSTASAETNAPDSLKGESSFHDEVKAARAKEKADDVRGPKERWWDRDAERKRPWGKPTSTSGGFPNHNDCRWLANAEHMPSAAVTQACCRTLVDACFMRGNRGSRVDCIDHDERSRW